MAMNDPEFAWMSISIKLLGVLDRFLYYPCCICIGHALAAAKGNISLTMLSARTVIQVPSHMHLFTITGAFFCFFKRNDGTLTQQGWVSVMEASRIWEKHCKAWSDVGTLMIDWGRNTFTVEGLCNVMPDELKSRVAHEISNTWAQ